jgi:hypothetical protein
LLVQPGSVRLEEVELAAGHPVGNPAVLLDVGLIHTRVGRDHDLVGDLSE